ncbi:hypothetical protein BH10ACT2_BH10ACT2_00270 [soil metagenome]
MHYRKLESEKTSTPGFPDKLLDLCGAGHLVRTLYTAVRNDVVKEPPPTVLALGEWADGDQDFLLHLVHSGGENQCGAGRTPNQLTTPIKWCESPPPGLKLVNLSPGAATTLRTVRLYQKDKDEWTIASRVDFAPPRRNPSVGMIPEDVRTDATRGVVIDDLGRGAVSDSLITSLLADTSGAELCEQSAGTKFYVRVKEPTVSWLHLLGDLDRLELVVLGPEVSPMLSPFERWHRDGAVTKEFLELIDTHSTLAKANNVVVLTDGREIIGKFRRSNDTPITIVGQSKASTHAINQVGWADAVVMSLALEMQKTPDPGTQRGFEDRVRNAIEQADLCRGVSGIPDWVTESSAPPDVKDSRSWERQALAWKQATEGLGIVDAFGTPSFDVWRGSSQLENYVSLIREKSDVLNEIGRSFRDFKRGHPERSVGIMVEADPGSGKSFLAQCLADYFGFAMIAVDVAQLVSRDDLVDYFDRIGTHQAESEVPVLAFVDEVNATIGNQPTYGAFLAPLEGNVYSRRGLTHTLKPCIWIFTGTKMKEGDSDEKRSDLRSRLVAYHRIDFTSLQDKAKESEGKVGVERVGASARLEQVYFGASMVRRSFPDVRSVELDVLRYFYALDPSDAPFRSIRLAVSTMRDVQHGEVKMSNLDVPKPALIADESIRKRDGKEFIRLTFRPGAPSDIPPERA